MKLEKHIVIDSIDRTAVDILGESTTLSRQAIKQCMIKGAVWLSEKQRTQRIRRAARVLKPGSCLHLYYDEEVLGQQPNNAILISDENLYSIWFKPYGMLCQGSKWGDHCTINRWVEKYIQPQRPAFIVHGLGRAATGLVILALQKSIAASFSKLFHDRLIEKQYHAIVHGKFSGNQTLDAEIDKKPAVSHVRRLKYDAAINQSLVNISIETGRKHQIRRHLSEAGFPVVGDRLYGTIKEKNDKNLCLTSCYISFISPADGTKKIYTLPEALSYDFS